MPTKALARPSALLRPAQRRAVLIGLRAIGSALLTTRFMLYPDFLRGLE